MLGHERHDWVNLCTASVDSVKTVIISQFARGTNGDKIEALVIPCGAWAMLRCGLCFTSEMGWDGSLGGVGGKGG